MAALTIKGTGDDWISNEFRPLTLLRQLRTGTQNQMNFNDLRGETTRLRPQLLGRKTYVVGTLEQLCQTLELTDAQLAEAQRRYQGVGEWLAGADSPLLRSLYIYLQGSAAIGTTVKPITRPTSTTSTLLPTCRCRPPIRPA